MRILCFLLLTTACGLSDDTYSQQQYYAIDMLRPLLIQRDKQDDAAVQLPGNISILYSVNVQTTTIGDHSGSVRTVLDNGNKLLEGYSFQPYGMPGSGSRENLFTATYTWDSTTRLYSSPTRKYAPYTYSFLSSDPQQQTASLYTFSAGNPINYTDRSGGIIRLVWKEEQRPATSTLSRLTNALKNALTSERSFDYALPGTPGRLGLPENANWFIKSTVASLDILHREKAMRVTYPNSNEPADVLQRVANDPDQVLWLREGNKRQVIIIRNDLHEERVFLEHNTLALAFKKNPSLPVRGENIGRHSSVLGLAHELFHAYHSLYDRHANVTRRFTPREGGLSNDEEELVTNLTNLVANTMGEDIRPGYISGFEKPYYTLSPMSVLPDRSRAPEQYRDHPMYTHDPEIPFVTDPDPQEFSGAHGGFLPE